MADGKNGGGEKPGVDRVGSDYRPQTASVPQQKVFATRRELETYVRSVCKFVDYMIDGVRLVGLDTKTAGNVYEVYQSDTLDVAMRFLERIPTDEIPELYHVIVETPSGNIGKDVRGMFDE
ncbi:MAG: hypothetical protein QM736_02615 [Vicinamibacterales bacterium]